MSKRIGLPVTLKMRHDAHYVEQLTSFSGAAVGRMVPIDKIRPNPEQPRKYIGDIGELSESIKEKGVLEPLLVRYMPREDTYHIISGERRYHASRAAGLKELPCIEKIADDAETLELALIENLQRKDLTAFEEADGLYRLAEQFAYTHEDIARKIAKARSSVTETLSLRNIPEAIRRQCVEHGIVSKSLLLQIARQPNEKKMAEALVRIIQGGLTRDEARARTPGREVRRAEAAALHLQFSAGQRSLPRAHSIPQEQCLAPGTDLHAARYSRLLGARHSRSCQRSRRRLGSGCGPKYRVEFRRPPSGPFEVCTSYSISALGTRLSCQFLSAPLASTRIHEGGRPWSNAQNVRLKVFASGA